MEEWEDINPKMPFKLLLFFILFSSDCIAQSNANTPFGFDKLHIEMSTSELISEMREPKEIKTYEDEKKVWTDGDYDLSKAVVFLIGFDKVYIFDYHNKYCLWKAYIKGDRVVYMNLTSTYQLDKYKENMSVNGEIKFGDSVEKVVSLLGKNFFPDRGFGYTDYLYNDLGIRFTFLQDKMTHVYFYRRLTSKASLYRLIKHYPKD